MGGGLLIGLRWGNYEPGFTLQGVYPDLKIAPWP
jgi:hypothetical protein